MLFAMVAGQKARSKGKGLKREKVGASVWVHCAKAGSRISALLFMSLALAQDLAAKV